MFVAETHDTAIAQANDPQHFLAIAVALHNGCTRSDEIAEALSMHRRQGSYYLNGMHTLGLADRLAGDDGHTWSLTTLGADLVAAPADVQVQMLVEVLAQQPLVQSELSEDPDEQALVTLACEEAGLTGETVNRRVSTVRSWARFVTLEGHEQSQLAAVAVAGVAEKAVEVSRARVIREAEAAAKAAAAAPQFCGTCYMQLPRTGVCNDC